MLIPDRLRTTTFRERKKARERVARAAEHAGKNILFAGPGFGRRPSTLLFVMAVMIVVGGMVIGRAKPRVRPSGKRSPGKVAAKELRVLCIALGRFRRDCGCYPETRWGLKSLTIDPGIAGWDGPYVNLMKPDPWKNHYRYRLDNGEITLFSCGPDGIEATEDDIVPVFSDAGGLGEKRKRTWREHVILDVRGRHKYSYGREIEHTAL